MTAEDTRPKLRRNLKFVRQESEGAVAYVVKDPSTMKYFRFGQIEAWLMQQMDGGHTFQQICDLLHAEVGLRAQPAALEVLVRRLKEMGLVERTPRERSALLMERVRGQRRSRRQNGNTLLRMRFSFGDPDGWMTRWVDRLAFFWTPAFIMASIVGFLLYTLLLVYNWPAFSAAMASLYSPSQWTIGILAMSYVTFAGIGIIHEIGHGLTCKRFGGEVHEIGAMLLYFTPAFYCNISDAWTFQNRAHRLWVTFAGGWIQLWVAAIAAVVWVLSEPGTVVHAVALLTAALAGSLSLLVNYNPLIPLDGYYALVDYLDLPNLRDRSFGYLGAVLKRHVLRMDVPVPAVTTRERRVFVTYGVAGILYTLVLLTMISLFVGRFLVGRMGGWGWFLFLLMLYALLAQPRAALTRIGRVFLTEKLPPGPRRRIALGAFAGALALGALTFVLPWTVRATVPVLVEPTTRHWLRPAEPARLTELRIREGAVVAAGDTIAVLREPELELAWSEASARLRGAEREAARARAVGDAVGARTAELAATTARARSHAIERRRDALVLRSPVDGIMVTPRLYERLGERVAAGDSLIEVWPLGRVHARIDVPQLGTGELRPGAVLRVRFPAHPRITWRTSVKRIESAAAGDALVARAPLEFAAGTPLLPGMIGRGRIDLVDTSIAGAVARMVRRNIRLDLTL
jgi:putative peptide zinc metalloprotease protein